MIHTTRSPQHSRMTSGGHARMSVDPDEIATLTLEEFLNLIPGNTPPPQVVDIFLQYRATIDPMMPTFHRKLVQRGERARALGWNVPLRYLSVEQPSRDEILTAVVYLYRQMLSEQYG